MNRSTIGVNSLPMTVSRQRRCCDSHPGPTAPESSTLTTRLPSQPAYQCVHGSTPSYLQNAICPVASAESRRRLRSASLADLIVPATRRTTMGAGPRLRRRSTARLEQSAGRDPSQPISGHLQTFTENSLLYPVFY